MEVQKIINFASEELGRPVTQYQFTIANRNLNNPDIYEVKTCIEIYKNEAKRLLQLENANFLNAPRLSYVESVNRINTEIEMNKNDDENK